MIQNILKKIFGRAKDLDVIVDKYSNMNVPESFSGGSLADVNILVVTNSDLPVDTCDEVFRKENTYYSVISLDNILTANEIIEAAKKLIGPFTHIINIFYDKKSRPLICNNTHYNNDDCVYQLYQWLQEEVDYLVKLNEYATICTVFICGSSVEGQVKKKNVEMCIKGLAEVLSNHGMICNGIISNEEVSVKELLNATIFLSSRYGQIMTGEILKLN